MNSCKKIYIICIYLISLYLSSNAVKAQFILSNDRMYNEAKEFIMAEEYKEALPYLYELQKKGFNSANIQYLIGKCQLNIAGKKSSAIGYLKNAIKYANTQYKGDSLHEKYSPIESIILLANAYRLNNELDKAIEYFSIYQDSIDASNVTEIALINKEIKKCKNALHLRSSPISHKKVMLPEVINHSAKNYNPILSKNENEIFFMGSRPFYDAIYRSTFAENIWTEPENLTPRIKSDGEYIIVGTSANGKTLLLYNYDAILGGELSQVSYNGKKWEKIEKLNSNINSKYDEVHASLSYDGKHLYFVSNRSGGYGGYDIYMCKKDENGEWGRAQNLGQVINSPFNETAPFVTEDEDIIFFSSNSHFNMGGYDIFYSLKDEGGEWQKPVNIGYPVNTTDDDLFFFPLFDGKGGFIAKIDENSGFQDIYRYTFTLVDNPSLYTISGTVVIPEDIDIEKENIAVSLIESEEKDTINRKNCDNKGYYEFDVQHGNYIIGFQTDGYKIQDKYINIPYNMAVDKLLIESELEMESVIKYDTFYVKNIYFNFDSFTIPVESKEYLAEVIHLLKNYPKISIHIKGYTDSKGNSIYNRILSKKRANSVFDFIIKENIEPKRMKKSGLGEEFPIALNKKTSGEDNPEGRKFNRRVEIEFENTNEKIIFINKIDLPDELIYSK